MLSMAMGASVSDPGDPGVESCQALYLAQATTGLHLHLLCYHLK